VPHDRGSTKKLGELTKKAESLKQQAPSCWHGPNPNPSPENGGGAIGGAVSLRLGACGLKLAARRYLTTIVPFMFAWYWQKYL
jgi:hypothetical protein